MPEGARRIESDYEKLGVEPEELEDYIGNAVVRVSELQAEKAQLEGEGAPKKEIAEKNREIRTLQKLIRDNENAFRRADERRKETTAKAKQDQLISRTKAAVARAKVGRIAKKEAPAEPEERTDEEMAKQAELIERTKAAVKTKTLIERTKAAVARKEKADKEARDMDEAERAAAEFRARLEARKQAREATEKELMNQLVAAMEAGPVTESKEERPFREQAEVNGIQFSVGWAEPDKRYEAYFPQIDFMSRTARQYGIHDQVFILDAETPAEARAAFQKIKDAIKDESDPYRAYAKAEAAVYGEKFEEPAPENLPVDEEETYERNVSDADVSARVRIWAGLNKKGREGMEAMLSDAAYGPKYIKERTRAFLAQEYPGWDRGDFQELLEQIALERDRLETEKARSKRFKEEATELATERLVEKPTARIDALREKIRKLKEEAKTERERLGTMTGDTEAEERFFEQGSKPEELARRERAKDLYPEETPDEAVAQMEKIEAQSARDFENEQDFATAFTDAVRNDPARRLNPDVAKEYAAQYWKLLQKDNRRLAEAMKPQPKVGFFRRIFGGAPKPKQVMTPQEIVQFQKMDKMVREIMEKPSTSLRSVRVGARSASRGPGAPTTMGRPPR